MAYYEVDKTENFDRDGVILRNWINARSYNTFNVKDGMAHLTNMSNMFTNKNMINTINLLGLQTNNVTEMRYTFSRCNNLRTLYMGNLRNVQTLMGAFQYCSNLSTFPNLAQCYNVTQLADTFAHCYALQNINGSTTGWVNQLNYLEDTIRMCQNCNSLNNIALTYWNMPNNDRMGQMFYGCSNLTNINMYGGNFPNVSLTWEMFNNCVNLKRVNLANCNLYGVTNATNMFYNCRNLTYVNLAGTGSFSNVTSVAGMFRDCYNFEYPYHSTWNMYKCTNFTFMWANTKYSQIEWDWSMNNATNLAYMYYNCTNLTEIWAAQSWTLPNVRNMYGMFYNCKNFSTVNFSKWKPNSLECAASMFFNHVGLGNAQLNDWNNMPNLVNTAFMFYNSGIEDVNLGNWNAPNLICTANMFGNCKNLYLYTWPVGFLNNVKDASSMFWNCTNITSLTQLNGAWALPQNSYGLMSNCINLSMNLWNCNVSRVQEAAYMFENCRSLTGFKASGYGDNMSNMEGMFRDCIKLNNANFYYWTPSKLFSMGNVFYNCYTLNNVSMNQFAAPNLLYLNRMFYNCTNLRYVYAAQTFFTNATYMNQMFYNCTNFTGGWYYFNGTSFSNIMYANQMFYNCYRLALLNSSGWGMHNAMYLNRMFYNCTNLVYVNFYGWSLNNAVNIAQMFYNCNKLNSATIENFFNLLYNANNVTYKNLSNQNSYSPFYGTNYSFAISSAMMARGWSI